MLDQSSLGAFLCHRFLFSIYCYRAKAQDFPKKGLLILNYRNENATPTSRYEDCVYTQNTRNLHQCRKCGISTHANQNESRQGCCSSCSQASLSSRNVPRRMTPACRNKGKCGSDNGYLHRESPIAMVYSPIQQWKELYDPTTALQVGTVFKELDLPFVPTPCRRKECSNCQYR